MNIGEKIIKLKKDMLDGFKKGSMVFRGLGYIIAEDRKQKEEERIERKYVVLPRRKD